MSIIGKLSSSTGKRSKETNKALAANIVRSDDHGAVNELVQLLEHKNKNIQSDAIETLYEAGYLNPAILSTHVTSFAQLLKSKNNRLVWGGMIALSSVSEVAADKVFSFLSELETAVNKGSVITKDAGITAYANLAMDDKFKIKVIPLLFNEMKICPIKQLPQYAEKSVKAINSVNKNEFIELINFRLGEFNKESQIKRINKVLKNVERL